MLQQEHPTMHPSNLVPPQVPGPAVHFSPVHLPPVSPNPPPPTHLPFDLPDALKLWDQALKSFHTYSWEYAIHQFKQLLRLSRASGVLIFSNQEEAQLWFNIGSVRALLGEYWLAGEGFAKCVELDRHFALGWFALGIALFQLEDFRRARKAFSRCHSLFKLAAVLEIPYTIYAGEDADFHSFIGYDLGKEWKLEKARVDWNGRISLFETNWKASEVERPGNGSWGLNGIPAGVMFGPCYEMRKADRGFKLLDVMKKKHAALRARRQTPFAEATQPEAGAKLVTKPLPPLPFVVQPLHGYVEVDTVVYRNEKVDQLRTATKKRADRAPRHLEDMKDMLGQANETVDRRVQERLNDAPIPTFQITKSQGDSLDSSLTSHADQYTALLSPLYPPQQQPVDVRVLGTATECTLPDLSAHGFVAHFPDPDTPTSQYPDILNYYHTSPSTSDNVTPTTSPLLTVDHDTKANSPLDEIQSIYFNPWQTMDDLQGSTLYPSKAKSNAADTKLRERSLTSSDDSVPDSPACEMFKIYFDPTEMGDDVLHGSTLHSNEDQNESAGSHEARIERDLEGEGDAEIVLLPLYYSPLSQEAVTGDFHPNNITNTTSIVPPRAGAKQGYPKKNDNVQLDPLPLERIKERPGSFTVAYRRVERKRIEGEKGLGMATRGKAGKEAEEYKGELLLPRVFEGFSK